MADPYQQRTANLAQRDLLDPDMVAAWRSTADRWQRLNPNNNDLVLACQRIMTLADEVIDLNRRVAEGRELRAEQDELIKQLREAVPADGEEVEAPKTEVSGTTNDDAESE